LEAVVKDVTVVEISITQILEAVSQLQAIVFNAFIIQLVEPVKYATLDSMVTLYSRKIVQVFTI